MAYVRLFCSNTFSFSLFFVRILIACSFFEMPNFICSIILKCPIFDSFLFENWAFQNNRTFQKKSTWWEFEQKRERNWKCSNFGHFKKICICHHVQNISFTSFSGHFIIPPVYTSYRSFSLVVRWYYIWFYLKLNQREIEQRWDDFPDIFIYSCCKLYKR